MLFNLIFLVSFGLLANDETTKKDLNELFRKLAEQIASNQTEKPKLIVPKRLQEAYDLLQETNKTCWTLVHVWQALEYAKNNAQNVKGDKNPAVHEMVRNTLSEIQSCLDKTSCNTKLQELAEKVKNLTATEQQILRDTKEFNHPDLSKFGSLVGLSNAYHYHILNAKDAHDAGYAFYSTDRAGQKYDEVNNNQPLSLEYCKELAQKLDESGSIEDLQQK